MVAGIDVAPPDGLSTPRPVAGRQHFEMQVCKCITSSGCRDSSYHSGFTHS